MFKHAFAAAAFAVTGLAHAFVPQGGTWIIADELNRKPGRGFAIDEHGGLTLFHGVGRAHADRLIADAGGGHEADDDGGDAGTRDRTADMWNRRRARSNHRADVHVGDAGGGKHGDGVVGVRN